MPTTVMFDVNETLLSLSPVREWFTARYGDTPSATMWFGELLRLSFVSSSLDMYTPFPELGVAALETVTGRVGRSASDDDLTHIASAFATLPAHSDTVPGIDHLRKAGFRTAALTNSPLATAQTQLENAGLAGRLDRIMSVDLVEHFKPHAAVYEAAATELGVPTSDIVMVAAHDWDIAGAMAAGCTGVFVARPGQIYSSAFAEPTLRAADIVDAANQIIDHYGDDLPTT